LSKFGAYEPQVLLNDWFQAASVGERVTQFGS